MGSASSSSNKSQRIAMVAALTVVSVILAVIAWKYSGGQDAFLSGLLKFISIVFFLLAGLSVVSMVIIGQSSHAELDKTNRRRPRSGGSSYTPPPTDDAFDFDDAEPDATPSSAKKPRPVGKKPRPVSQANGAQKKPRPVRKLSEE